LRRTARLVVALCLLAALSAPAAVAAERMWLGFHDDPSFRWASNRAERVQASADSGSTILRLLVQWDLSAKQRPERPTDPFDPAYVFDDVDEAVRAAQIADQEVMLTISGTPSWANGGKRPNVMPTNLADLTAFARAISSRYSGRYAGFPFVRFWSVWNEPNLQLFLTPQFDARGRSVAPANYAKLYAAAYAGIKAGNPDALVAIGETSARGTDKPTGVRPTHSPGKFAELVAKANPKLKFAAWSHHPYPTNPNMKPSQLVKWPSVSLRSLPRFEESLKAWFKRPSVPIWITEYGHQTKPPDSLGVTYLQQGKYIQEAIAIAKSYPFVHMFIWFVYQDDPGQPWESGIYSQAGLPKGSSPAKWSASVRPLDARSPVLELKGGTQTPLVTLYGRTYCVNNPIGSKIGMTWRVFRAGRLIAVGQQTSQLRRDCTVTARLLFRVAKGQTYTATFALNDIHGTFVDRRLTIRGT
jgi:hypothetical protein